MQSRLPNLRYFDAGPISQPEISQLTGQSRSIPVIAVASNVQPRDDVDTARHVHKESFGPSTSTAESVFDRKISRSGTILPEPKQGSCKTKSAAKKSRQRITGNGKTLPRSKAWMPNGSLPECVSCYAKPRSGTATIM